MSSMSQELSVTLHSLNAMHQCTRNSPKDDEVHAIFALVIVLNETLVGNIIHRLNGRHFFVHTVIRIQVWIHVITKHQLAKVSFHQLNTQQ